MKKSVIKKLGLLLMLLLTFSLLAPIGNTKIEAKVKMNKKQITLSTGEWKKLKIKNMTYEIGDIKWSSSDKAVANVSRKGWVVGLVKGKCKITAEVLATGKTFTCDVTVETPDAKTRVIDPTKPIIALTFDDGPAGYTNGLLDTLKSYGVTATFFMCNNNCVTNGISKYADTIREMYNYGCEIANHTNSHPQLSKISEEKIKSEVLGNADVIKKVIGTNNRLLLRPPYGAYNDTVKAVCQAPIILWSVDTLDWKVKGQSNATDLILSEIKKSAHDGYIILMHDIHSTSCEAVKAVIPWLIQQGYQVCSVSEMFEARGVELEDGVVYTKCITAEQYKSKK